MKEFPKSGGGSTTVLSAAGKSYFVCDGVVFLIEQSDLQQCFCFLPPCLTPDGRLYFGVRLDGAPYHGDSHGNYAALAYDDVGVVLQFTPTSKKK
jgi:hypothetical protein